MFVGDSVVGINDGDDDGIEDVGELGVDERITLGTEEISALGLPLGTMVSNSLGAPGLQTLQVDRQVRRPSRVPHILSVVQQYLDQFFWF